MTEREISQACRMGITIGTVIGFTVLIAFRESRGECKVRGFRPNGKPFVKYNGFDDFVVNFDEIRYVKRDGKRVKVRNGVVDEL